MSKYTSLDHVADTLIDESVFQRFGSSWRNPAEPNFIFFDDPYDRDAATEREAALAAIEAEAARTTWREDEPTPQALGYFERMEAKRQALWLIGFHKRQLRMPSNDRWHKVLAVVGSQVDLMNPEQLQGIQFVQAVAKALSSYAPGPVRGTTFRNPDGTSFETKGTSPMAAKEAFKRRHGLSDEFVSVDRVQYAGERTSRYVVGLRRNSAETPSRYYDPNPRFTERRLNGEWVREYDPNDGVLYAVPASGVFEGHRLTVREFERAIISGAELADDEADEIILSLGDNAVPTSYQKGPLDDLKLEEELTDEESYLRQLLIAYGEDEAADALLMKEVPDLRCYVFANGQYSENLLDLLKYVDWEDKARAAAAAKVGEPAPDAMFPFVRSALLGL